MAEMLTSAGPLILVGLVFLWTVGGEESTVCVWGESCILPCTFPFGEDTLIHWYQMPEKYGVHSFYDNRDQLKQQKPEFRDRTSLFRDEIPRGNASLLLMRVKVEDEGPYLCYTGTASNSLAKTIELTVEALVHEVNIVQENDRITCSSERNYPEPTLSWSPNPQEVHNPQVQMMEDQLYNISSTIVVNTSINVNYSCTVSSGRYRRTTTLFQLGQINTSVDETTISCCRLNTRVTQLTWRFNHTEIILTRTGTSGGFTLSDSWKNRVKNVSPAGDLQLQHLSSIQEGTFTCELSSNEETYVTVTKLSYSKGERSVSEAPSYWWVAGLVIAVLVLVLVGVLAYLKVGGSRSKQRKDPEEGAELRLVKDSTEGSGPLTVSSTSRPSGLQSPSESS